MNLSRILFSNLNDDTLSCLTAQRTVAAIPFGCRYRLVDFPLSAMVRAGITDISVVSNYSFHSLSEHIGSGKDWDLARHTGGIKIVTPFRHARGVMYDTRLGALSSMQDTIDAMTAEYVVLGDCNAVFNPDLSEIMAAHLQSGAYVTMVAAPPIGACEEGALYMTADSAGRITDMRRGRPTAGAVRFLGMMVLSRADLLGLIGEARAHGYTSLTRDVLMRTWSRRDCRVFVHRSYYAVVSDFSRYYACSMALLADPDLRRALLADPKRPIYTRVRHAGPTVYASGASVQNSLVAEGCRIEGRVEGSILFRGVTVGRGSVVRNSILFGGCYVGSYSSLHAVCAEKRTVICDRRTLSGHRDLPLFIERGKVI